MSKMSVDFGACQSLFDGPYFIPIYGWTQILMGILIIIWQKMKRKDVLLAEQRRLVSPAESSDEAATRLVLLPVYIYFLWMFVVADFIEGVIAIFFPSLSLKDPNSLPTSLIYAFAWAQYHFVIEGLAVLLLQHGAGISAFRRSLIAASFVSVWTMGTEFIAFYYAGSSLGFAFNLMFECVLGILYFLLWVLPPSFLYRRPAARPYAIFWCVIRLAFFASAMLRFYDYAFGYCIYLVFAGLGFGLLKPLLVFHVLLADSHYWRGLFSEKIALQGPLSGISLETDSARSLALGMDGLRQQQVKMLDHAFLDLGYMAQDAWKVIGHGGSCRVYQASYKGKPVAVKMVWCVELTPATIQNFVREASLLSQLNHECVVQLEGVCVRPPALCLVMELCEYGSLWDVLRQPQRQPPTRSISRPRLPNFRSSSVSSASINRSVPAGIIAGYAFLRDEEAPEITTSKRVVSEFDEIPLTWRNRMLMALQCAQAVAFLHRQTPPLLHLDLKPQNFLVASATREQQARTGCPFQVKISDLELTLSFKSGDLGPRTFSFPALSGRDSQPRGYRTDSSFGQNTPYHPPSYRPQTPVASTSALPDVLSSIPLSLSESTNLLSPSFLATVDKSPETLRVPETINWVAPELLSGEIRRASLKADVYALGMVLYEILTLKTPYTEYKSGPLKEAIQSGYRPPLPFDDDDGPKTGDGETVPTPTDEKQTKPPRFRFPSMSEFQSDDESSQHRSTTSTTPKTSTPKSQPFTRQGSFDPTNFGLPRDAPLDQVKRLTVLIKACWDQQSSNRPHINRCVDVLHSLCVSAQTYTAEYVM